MNSDYEAKRYKDLNLVRPVIRSVPRGPFNKWLKAKNKLGGQNKVPRLSNTRDYIEEINRIIAGGKCLKCLELRVFNTQRYFRHYKFRHS